MLNLTRKQMSGDIFGGVTASVVALPLALAFGVASGAGPEAGLYGAIVLGFVAALAGGTRVQISGPTGPMTVVAASSLVMFHGDVAMLMAAVLLTGLFQIVLGLLKIGKFVKFVPYPVISGFMSGIGIIIILLQINPLLGIAGVSSPIQAVVAFSHIATSIQMEALYVSVIALVIVFLTPKRLARVIPTPLLALVTLTLITRFFGWQVPTIGEIPTGLPDFRWPNFSIEQMTGIVSAGLSLAVLGSIDSLLTSLVADSLTKTEHDSNRELIGQGVGNSMAAFFGGIPGAGATMRTVVNVKSGGTTRLSGMIHAVLLLAILLGLGEYAAMVPMAVLAAILIKVGLDIVDYRFIKILRQAPKHDLAVMFTVLVLTVFVDLIMAVAVGVVLASVLLTVRMTKMVKSSVSDYRVDTGLLKDCSQVKGKDGFLVRVVAIEGPFFFGSTSQLVGQVGAMLGTKAVIFNALAVPLMDLSAFFSLSEIVLKLKGHGIVPLIVVDGGIREKMLKLGIEKILHEKHIFLSFDAAVDHAREHICDNRINRKG